MLDRNQRKKTTQELGEHQTRMYFFNGLKFVKSPELNKPGTHVNKPDTHLVDFPIKMWVSIAMFDGLKVQADKFQLLLG